tara:strand:+ start:5660 stop:5881 length:222 start_codon:yes stop_codon:yes gene_type:complete
MNVNEGCHAPENDGIGDRHQRHGVVEDTDLRRDKNTDDHGVLQIPPGQTDRSAGGDWQREHQEGGSCQDRVEI